MIHYIYSLHTAKLYLKMSVKHIITTSHLSLKYLLYIILCAHGRQHQIYMLYLAMKVHRNNLQKLCRICGSQKSTWKHKDWVSCEPLVHRIERTFRLIISHDQEDIHPKNICKSCYRSMTRFVYLNR